MDREPEIRRLFARWASPVSLGVGAVFGLVYTLLVFLYDPFTGGTINGARAWLAFLFLTAGAMGTAYFEIRAYAASRLPYIIEILRYFFLLWTAFGALWVVRIFGDDPPPQEEWALYAVTFLTGWIAGTVWTMALILLAGIRYDVGQWEVVRFPAWLFLAAAKAWGWLKRTGRG